MRCASLREGSFYLKIHRDVKYYQHINTSTLQPCTTPLSTIIHNLCTTLWILCGFALDIIMHIYAYSSKKASARADAFRFQPVSAQSLSIWPLYSKQEQI